MQKLLVSFLFLLTVLSVTGFAQLTGKNRWVNVKTKNFNIIGDASEMELRDVATKLEQFRETFRVLFRNMNLTSPIETNVVVFRSSSSFRPFRPKRADGKADEGVAGYFQPGEARNYIALSTEGTRDDTYGTIYHEYIHYLMDTNIGRASLPAWFNEGIAEYYQTLRIENDQKVYLGALQHGHLELLRNSKMIPLKEFLRVANTSATGGHTRSVFYAQAWLFMHYLMHANNGSYSEPLNKYVSLLRREIDEDTAFTQSFGADYAAVELALQKYLRQSTMSINVYTHNEKLLFDADMSVRALSEGEANMNLGDLLYHSHDYTSSEKYLARALELEPESVFAKTSLGLVRMRQRKFDDARNLLESATAAASSDYYANYNYAYILSRQSMDEFGFVRSFPETDLKKMQAVLRRSIALKPDFAESYSLLVFVNAVNGVELADSLELLKAAQKIQPGNQYYALQMADVLLRMERYDEARAIAGRMAGNAVKPEHKSRAAQIIQAIDQMAAAKKFNEEQREAMERAGVRGQTLVRRETVSPEEVERLETDREIRNLNRLVEAPKPGEKQIVGRIKKIACVSGIVRYEIETESGPLMLASKDFQSLNFQILHTGTTNFEIGCNAELTAQLMVANYRIEEDKKLGIQGTLTDISFVPTFFRVMSQAELNEPQRIVIGGPPTDLAENERKIAEELAEFQTKSQESFEQQQKHAILAQINAQLRAPLPGELRGIGAFEKLECTSKEQIALVKFAGETIRMRLPKDPASFRLMSFVPDLGGAFRCGYGLPDVKAVITYLPDSKAKGKVAGEIKALELVPPSFELQ